MYKVVKRFADLQDDGYRYKPGDVYPHEGAKTSSKRIEQLAGFKNRQGTPLIEKVEPIDNAVKEIEDAGVMPTPSVDPEEYKEAIEETEKPKPKRGRKPKTKEE